MQDTFDEIASSILISDAQLALTFIHIGTCRSEAKRQRTAFMHAADAYDSICNSLSCIRMNETDYGRLGAMLLEIKAKLDEASRDLVSGPTAS